MFDPVDFYHLASKLHTDASDESTLRSSVSRAYYAAFLWAREKAGVTSQSGNIHEKVINHYQLKKKSISNRLADLRHGSNTTRNPKPLPRLRGRRLPRRRTART